MNSLLLRWFAIIKYCHLQDSELSIRPKKESFKERSITDVEVGKERTDHPFPTLGTEVIFS